MGRFRASAAGRCHDWKECAPHSSSLLWILRVLDRQSSLTFFVRVTGDLDLSTNGPIKIANNKGATINKRQRWM